jgi:hypothetical protein
VYSKRGVAVDEGEGRRCAHTRAVHRRPTSATEPRLPRLDRLKTTHTRRGEEVAPGPHLVGSAQAAAAVDASIDKDVVW